METDGLSAFRSSCLSHLSFSIELPLVKNGFDGSSFGLIESSPPIHNRRRYCVTGKEARLGYDRQISVVEREAPEGRAVALLRSCIGTSTCSPDW